MLPNQAFQIVGASPPELNFRVVKRLKELKVELQCQRLGDVGIFQ